MIARTPEQQALYDARLKFQRDEAAKLEGARLEGRAEGEKEGLRLGVLIGRILTLGEYLDVKTLGHVELAVLSECELSAMADGLQSQLRLRGQ